ncbi:outer membrane lipoprotein chaperone LolA [Arenimonas sp.]|jgi:outer membrane lipoprotein carrier protein|uniref:outer membrane lipoprotein chaperone LolA n=1 Tax=Arenimonas sp. TaxID=1872635 RepID=UPI0037C1431D
MRQRLLIILLFVIAFPVQAQTARQQLNVFASGLKTASATFQQVVTGPNGENVQSAQGLLQMKSPNRFRWEYSKPNDQLIVADGTKIWVYEPDLKQVTVKPQDALNQDNPLSALSSPEALERFYKLTELPEQRGIRWLQLVPKRPESSPFDKALLGFDGNGLRSMRLFDNLGQVSEFRFGSWKRNAAIADNKFRFTTPKGVEEVQ